MSAYYNEIDPFAAQWLRNLIAAGHIAPGEVDERSIEDVTPDDLKGFTQIHLFAGISAWSLALRRAGWPDDQPVWTGSCPCQPFSPSGKKLGFADERHLWPAMHWLVGQRRPVVIFGEQSGSAHAQDWIDLVQADVEALGYAFGAVAFPSAGVGAPHIRDRAYWVADSTCQQWQRRGELQPTEGGKPSDSSAIDRMANTNIEQREECLSGCRESDCTDECREAVEPAGHCRTCRMADSSSNRRERRLSGRQDTQRETLNGQAGCDGAARGLAGTYDQQRSQPLPDGSTSHLPGEWRENSEAVAGCRGNMPATPINSLWRDADWLLCRDGKWRPVEPGIKPLVNGLPGRVGRLRAYGNALNVEAATVFIRAYMAGCI
ncbi:TPA: DNA cytosine methyltransferase [Enterobacter ludwigii]|nr:DNA cytosine methyltransferase [Enterobacter ludwigii]HDR2591110.1 DNA cytosine methyltransferase [Enterobacter ludwigii]HDR2598695.1 DNA cytosine methyltransferase [Enterobacter ludwigii]